MMGFTQNKAKANCVGVSLAVTGDGLTRCLSGSGQRSNSIHKSAANSPVEIQAWTPQPSPESRAVLSAHSQGSEMEQQGF